MKNIKLLLVSMLAAVFSGCMDHHDDPTNYTYGGIQPRSRGIH